MTYSAHELYIDRYGTIISSHVELALVWLARPSNIIARALIVWLARPSHLIAGVLRAGKGRSSGSND